jgi:hypothetical protein
MPGWMPLNLNDNSHLIPLTGEVDWGDEVNDYLEDISFLLDGTYQEIIATGATTNIDFREQRNTDLTLNASTELVFSNPRAGRPLVFQIFQGGSYTITWPANIKWRGGTAPTITTGAGAIDVVCLLYNSTRNIYTGEFAQDFS